ncbi:hypothetical protein [Prescottella agglutinans]|uniref:Endogenous inhibitor of DNA gyrase (YacG/DUF329 family) n=1 Tax=Prescottella agglutinans TaxID=1644129 RepID=A0ABT6MI19_9NOCA|nr:hypothetical protein [Prescottella agglutinans]MDH6283942.1 endogenous inhibitor of DNA gyrase (YacG/DUF329 family) [Prescottella agglutinans]
MSARVRGRRCASCHARLPRDADVRRRYCSPRCVARAYRKRVRYAERHERAAQIVHLFASLTFPERAAVVSGVLEFPDIQCPVCGVVVWQGVRRRSDARYCSAVCRSKAYRERRKHDAKP